MFEQSLYNQEAFLPVPDTDEGDLFHNFEVKNWDFSPRLYKILAAAAVLDLLFLVVFAQADLTKSGCDTFITSTVCQVIDTAYVATSFFGTKRDYVDAVYDKTTIKDSDEVVFVEATDPFTYPDGYFQPTPEQQSAMMPGMKNFPAPGSVPPMMPLSPGPSMNSLLDRKQKLPKNNPKAVIGPFPTSPLGDSADDNPAFADKKVRGGRKLPGDNTAKNDSNSSDQTDPKTTPMSSDAVTAVQIKKQVLTDFADGVAAQQAKKEVDLNQPFTVVLNAVLTPDGRLDRDKSSFDTTKQAGDPGMIDVAKAALEAVGDSGYLTYLKNLNVDKVTVTLTQDDKQITAVITSSQKSAERAKVVADGLHTIIGIAAMAAKDSSDELTLLKGASVTSDGKSFILNFAIPKPIAQEMIDRKLKEAQAKKAQQPQPSSAAAEKPNQNTAIY